MARQIEPDDQGYVYFGVVTQTWRWNPEARTHVEGEPYQTETRYGPYRNPQTASAAAKNATYFRADRVVRVERMKFGPLEPYRKPKEELIYLRAENAKLHELLSRAGIEVEVQ